MKTALFALFLLAISTSKFHSTSADFVVDTDGNYLQNGGTYYIVPGCRGRDGGIGRTKTGNETCPLTVVQSPSELDDGLPLVLASPYRIATIYEGLILDISFTALPLCAPTPSKWSVVLDLPEGPAVKLSGYYENTVAGWFKIEKHLSDYKLVFCSHSGVTCADLGIYVDDDGNRRLVVSKHPLTVMFKKYSSSAAAV